jgi:hypothetical protein
VEKRVGWRWLYCGKCQSGSGGGKQVMEGESGEKVAVELAHGESSYWRAAWTLEQESPAEWTISKPHIRG